MAKFIKLTNTDEPNIFINVDQIQTITKDENDIAIQFEDGTIFVKETPARILHSIQSGGAVNILPVVDVITAKWKTTSLFIGVKIWNQILDIL